MKIENATWDTHLSTYPQEVWPTYKSKEKVPEENQVVKAIKIGGNKIDQVIRVGDNLYLWRYKTTDTVFCGVNDDYVWRACRGMDF